MTIRAVSVAAAVLALAVAAFAQNVRRDGKWEVTMQMEMAGMPAAIPPTTTTQCITPEEAKDAEKAMPPMGRGGRGRGGDSPCKTTDQKIEGNKVTANIKCEGAMPMTGTAEFEYAADAYTGTVKMETGRGAMTMKYNAKRVGDCVK
jgi:hypothetical protein